MAIIMDGNRRWAKERNKSVREGHKAGADKLTEAVDWCIELNIKYLTLYTFSTENWKREASEINDIMSLLKIYLSSKKDEFNKKGVKVKVIGIEDNVEKDIIDKIRSVEEKTKDNDVLQLNIAFNYGGRREILDTTKKIASQVAEGSLSIDDINEDVFKGNLYYGKIPDPDLVIRTGGDNRISNFLLWEIAYSEFYFADTFWPGFSREFLVDIIDNFNKRERRYGGTIKK